MGRWWPDPDSYGVDSHPERFAGLPSVALALIEHLAAVYDVEFHKGPAHAKDLLIEARDVLQAMNITPPLPGAAPLTFVLTAYVTVHAGALPDFHSPCAHAMHVMNRLRPQHTGCSAGCSQSLLVDMAHATQ